MMKNYVQYSSYSSSQCYNPILLQFFYFFSIIFFHSYSYFFSLTLIAAVREALRADDEELRGGRPRALRVPDLHGRAAVHHANDSAYVAG